MYEQLLEVKSSVSEAVELLNRLSPEQRDTVRRDMSDSIRAINRNLFGYDLIEVEGMDFPQRTDQTDITGDTVRAWDCIISKVIKEREECGNYLDRFFRRIMDCAEHVSHECMLTYCKHLFHKTNEHEQKKLITYYQGYHYFWGTLDPDKDNYEAMDLRIRALKDHREDFLWLYKNLEDYRSRHVLIKILEYWMTFRVDSVLEMKENCFGDYFDLDILPVSEQEVVVDLGGFDGDTIMDYVRTYGRYHRIYTFEVSRRNVEKIKENTKGFHDIVIVNKAAGDRKGTIMMNIGDEVFSENTAIATGNNSENMREVEVTTVDDEVQEPVTMIKMDIEGAEKDALKGCRRHIVEDHPKLLICVYHNNEDIWKIPRMIREMAPDYRFYLRSNGKQWGPAEIVLFGI